MLKVRDPQFDNTKNCFPFFIEDVLGFSRLESGGRVRYKLHVTASTELYPKIYPSYTTLSSGIPWTIPRSIVFSRYTYEPLGERVYQETTSDKWDIPYHERSIT